MAFIHCAGCIRLLSLHRFPIFLFSYFLLYLLLYSTPHARFAVFAFVATRFFSGPLGAAFPPHCGNLGKKTGIFLRKRWIFSPQSYIIEAHSHWQWPAKQCTEVGDRIFRNWWDWTWLILLPAIALSRIAQARISAAHNHYSRMDAGPRINGPSHLLKRHPKSGGGIIRLMAP